MQSEAEASVPAPAPDGAGLVAFFASCPGRLRPPGASPALGAIEAAEADLCGALEAALAEAAPDARGRLLRDTLAGLGDVSLPCAFLRKVAAPQSGEGDGQKPEPYFGAATEELRRALLAQVKKLAASGALWAQASPAALLWFWWTFGQSEEVYAFTQAAMREAAHLAGLLDVAVDQVILEGKAHDVIAVRRWSKLIDFHGLEQIVVPLAMSAPSREDRRRARRFLDAYANGKSELFR